MTTREQVEAEARELYPAPADPYTPHEAFQERAAYVRAKTVTAEQVEAAAEGLFLHERYPSVVTWGSVTPPLAHEYRRSARATLRAAGLLIEGDDDD